MAEAPKFLAKIQELRLSGTSTFGQVGADAGGLRGGCPHPKAWLFHPEKQIELKASRGL